MLSRVINHHFEVANTRFPSGPSLVYTERIIRQLREDLFLERIYSSALFQAKTTTKMWNTHLILSGINLLATACLAHPWEMGMSHRLVQRAVSPDNTCGKIGSGNNLGYTCGTGTAGPCCSQNVSY